MYIYTGDHVDEFESISYLPPAMLDYNNTWRKTINYPQPDFEGIYNIVVYIYTAVYN